MLIADVSSNNRPPNWALVKRAGVAGVWLKATEGVGWTDPKVQGWRTEANRAGLRVGLYHYARPDLHPFEARAEAAHFAAIVGRVGTHDLRPVLDYEVRSSHGNDEQWAREFTQFVKARLGVGPLFYSYSVFIAARRFKAPIGYGLWLAAYSRNDGKEHPFTVPAPWRKAAAHQFSSRCQVVGCTDLVDLSSVLQPNAVLAHPVRSRVATVLPWRGPH